MPETNQQVFIDKAIAEKILGSLQFSREKGKGPNFLKASAQKHRRTTTEKQEVEEEEKQFQEDKMQYFRQVQQLKRQRVGNNANAEAEQDVQPGQAQVEAAKQQVMEFYERQKAVMAEKQAQKDAEQAAKLAALYRQMVEGNSPDKIQKLFAATHGADDLQIILEQLQQQTVPLVPAKNKRTL